MTSRLQSARPGRPDPGPFADLLLRHRLSAGLSQRELAEQAGLSERAVRDLERGTTAQPRKASVRAVAAALGLGGDELTRFLATALGASEAVPLSMSTMDDLVGRGRELRRLADLITGGRHRLVTVTGAGGVGKSRLVAELVAALRRHTTMDVRTLDLAGLSDPDLVGEAITHALDTGDSTRPVSPAAASVSAARPAGTASPSAASGSAAPVSAARPAAARPAAAVLPSAASVSAASGSGGRVVLVLDRFEHLLPAADTVAEFVRRRPGLFLLLTSQRPLRVGTERRFQLEPLPIPAAVELFARRAAAVTPGFTLTADSAEAVEAICRAVDGLPLAVELVAARTRLMTPADLAARLDRSLGLLSGGPADLPARHRSLRATIEASLAVVTEDARTLFAWLGAFADGARLADLEAVVESLGSGRDWLRAALGELIDTSLVRVEDLEGASRCVMPDAMTELAREHLSARADRAAVQRAVAIRFLERVRRFEQDPQRDDRREAGNIRVAVQDAIAHDITLLDDDSLRALRTFHELNGLPKEGQRLQTAAGDAGVPIGYLHAGRIARLQGDLAEAARFGQLAMNRLDTTDTTVLTAVRMHLGAVATEAGDSAVARSHFRAVLVAARRSKDLGRIGNALNNLGALSAETGRLEDAERLFLAALEARYRSGASELLIGDCLHNLAEVALEMGRYGLAVKRAEQAAPQVSDRMISHAATIRALALVGLGRVAEAREAIRLVERWLGEAHEEGRYAALIGIRTSVVLAAAGETASAAQLLSAWVPVMLDSIPRYHDEVASMLEAHARILAPAKAATAARLLGAAHALRRRSSRLVSAALVSNAEAVAAVCRDALGDKGFELEHLAGTRLGADALAGLCAGL